MIKPPKLQGVVREAAAEFLGTFVLLLLGDGVVAQVILSRKNIDDPLSSAAGSYLTIVLGWGLAVTFGIYCSLGVSGAHLNPAVTATMAVHRKFPLQKIPAYIGAQFLGAFCGSLVVYLNYIQALRAAVGSVRAEATAGIWATYPQPFLNTWGGVLDQLIGTAMLLCGIFALTDAENAAPSQHFPIFVGLLVMAIGASLGFNTGYAINPARDFAPRVFTAMGGWGGHVFSYGHYWFWVPLVICPVGGILGGFIYDLFVGYHHPNKEDMGTVQETTDLLGKATNKGEQEEAL
eukprot:TRINITY_DN65845_c2_g1_i1.p1 TRINITY_DN65845_c2_g1~~TRINITY_DN65845_c2_g1_i1.p1  ORF type:complete len:291 (-),score=18.76 TRINITY_DN65845_c2_g1_i1:41-913(-)